MPEPNPPTWRELVDHPDDPVRRHTLENWIREMATRVSEHKLVFESDFDELIPKIADAAYAAANEKPDWTSPNIEQSIRGKLSRHANKLHIERTSGSIWIHPPAIPLDPHESAFNDRLERFRALFNGPSQAQDLLRLYVNQGLTVDGIASQKKLEPAIVLMALWRALRELRELLMS